MRIGAAIFLVAVGAILKFAVHPHNTHGFDVGTIGVILMIVGAVGLVITLVAMGMRRRTDVVNHGPAGTSRTTYVHPRDVDSQY